MTCQDVASRHRLGLTLNMRNNHPHHVPGPFPLSSPDATSADAHGPLRRIAEQVADCFAASGYAFVEDDKIDGLAVTLGSFLTSTGILITPHPKPAP